MDKRKKDLEVFSPFFFCLLRAFCCHCIVNTSCHIDTCGALYRVQKLAFFFVFLIVGRHGTTGESKVF